jgi:hypothetical protein
MLCSDKRIRGKPIQLNDISRQQFSKIASRRFQGRMTLTGQGLVLGAGTLLAKLGDNALPVEAEQERIWTLLAVAYGEKISPAVLGSLRRVAKHWQGGDKCLAAIHLAQMGLPDIGEDAAYRLALAAEPIPRLKNGNPPGPDASTFIGWIWLSAGGLHLASELIIVHSITSCHYGSNKHDVPANLEEY